LSRKYKDFITLVRQSSPATNICLRRLDNADFANLAKLWLASWQEAMPEIDFSARFQWFVDHMRTLEAAGFVTVCAIDGPDSIVGFVSIHPDTAYLDQLAVAPAAKGTGVARLLLGEARRISPQNIVLEVNEDNRRALAFYKREGFEKISEGVNPRSGLKTFRLRGPASFQRSCNSS
jgi:putative acetyltransferase